MQHKINGANKHGLGLTIPTKGSGDLGVSVSRQTLSPVKSPQVKSNSGTPLPHEHKKIAFAFTPRPFQSMQNTLNQSKPAQDTKQRKDSSSFTPPKPASATASSNHICLRIENGKSTSFEKSPDGAKKVIKDSRKSNLVPYDDDSDSDHEKKSGTRVALKFDQEKENVCEAKATTPGAFTVFSGPPSPSAKNGLRKERSEPWSYKPGHVRPGGFDSKVPRNLTLKLNRDPMRKMTVDTSSPTRGTNGWFVQVKDPACSPSLGSCSSNNSNHSTNSTTEWTTPATDADKKSEAKRDLWRVSESVIKRKRHLLNRADSLEEMLPTPPGKVKRASSEDPLPKQSVSNDSNAMNTSNFSTSKSCDADFRSESKTENSVDERLGHSSISNHESNRASEREDSKYSAADANNKQYDYSDQQALINSDNDYSSSHKKKKSSHCQS